MHKILRITETLVRVLSGHIQGWIIFFMMCLVLVDVTTRYLLQNPLSIAEEFGGYLLVAITCMGLAFAWQERSHVRIELLVRKLPARLRQWLRLFTVSVAFVFTLFMLFASYELVSFSFMFGQKSGSWTRTPLAYPQIAILIGAILLLFQLIVEIAGAARTLKAGEEGDKS